MKTVIEQDTTLINKHGVHFVIKAGAYIDVNLLEDCVFYPSAWVEPERTIGNEPHIDPNSDTVTIQPNNKAIGRDPIDESKFSDIEDLLNRLKF